jgi:hypothetical protein
MVLPPDARVELDVHILQRCGEQPGLQVAIANKKEPLIRGTCLQQGLKHAFFR